MNKQDYSELSITPRLISEEFSRRGVEFEVISSGTNYSLFEYADSSGVKRLVRNVVHDANPGIALKISNNKQDTYAIARRLGIPVPEMEVFETIDQVQTFLKRHKQIVVKPLDAAHGNGVTVGISLLEEAEEAIKKALIFSDTVLIQKYINVKHDLRLLFIDGVFRAASNRIPASVVGDDRHTLRQLIEQENASNNRAESYSEKLCVISLDTAAQFLGERIDKEIPESGKVIQVVGTANIGTGGQAIGVTDTVNQQAVAEASKLIEYLGMKVCGVDFIMDDNDQFYLIELNASPSFGLHHYPHEGAPVDVASYFVDMIMRPKGE